MRTRCVFMAVLSLFVCLNLLAAAPLEKPEPRYISHGGAVGEEYIVAFADTVDAADVESAGKALEREYGVKVLNTFKVALQGLHVRATPAVAKQLAHHARVKFVEENAAMEVSADSKETAAATAAAALYEPGWSLHRISHRERIDPNARGTYSYANGGDGVIAYVFDSGVLSTHFEFEGRVTRGYDTWTRTSPGQALNPCPVGPAGPDSCPANDICRDGSHGTTTASILGGRTFGVAPGVTLVSVRVANCQRLAPMSNVLIGLEWVLGTHLPSLTEFHGAVLNMSVNSRETGDPILPTLALALTAAIERGVVPVTGAGNANLDACGGYPAAYAYGNGQPGPHVITASGVNPTDARLCDSLTNDDDGEGRVCTGPEYGFGRCVDIFAPAVDIRAAALRNADPNGPANRGMRLFARAGTSWASPHVAGAAARLMTEHGLYDPADPAATADKVWRLMRDTSSRGMVIGPGGTGDNQSANRLLYIGAVKITEQPQSAISDGATSTPLVVGAEVPPGVAATYEWFSGGFTHPVSVQRGPSNTFNAPASPQPQSYWVRISHPVPDKPGNPHVTADSVLATVTPCAGIVRPEIKTRIEGGRQRLYVDSNSGAAAQYEWFIGAPGDVHRSLGTTPAPFFDFTPTATNDYWVRVSYTACARAGVPVPIDSSNYIAVEVCPSPRITDEPDTAIVGDDSYELSVVATGSNVLFQWYEVTGSGAVPVQGAIFPTLRLSRPPSGGMVQTFFARITSACGSRPSVETRRARVTWVTCDVDSGRMNDPNANLNDPNRTFTVPRNFPDPIFVSPGGGVALTVVPVNANGDPATPPVTTRWTRGSVETKASTLFAERPETAGGTVFLTFEQAGTPDCDRPGQILLQTCGQRIIQDYVTDHNTGVGQVTLMPGHTDARVEWREGNHDDREPVYGGVDELGTGRVSTRTFTPGTKFWARVTVKCPERGEQARATQDTGCAPVHLRHPVTGAIVELRPDALYPDADADADPNVYFDVAHGGSIALNATTGVRWVEGARSHTGFVFYVQSVTTERRIRVETTEGCFSGYVVLRPHCQPLITNPPQTVSVKGDENGTLTVAHHNGSAFSNVRLEWREGAHDANAPVVETGLSVTRRPTRSFWVRAIATCSDGTEVVDDSPFAFISCSNCRVRPVRHGLVRVNGTSTAFHRMTSLTDSTTFAVPDSSGNGVHEWRTNTEYSLDEAPIHIGATFSREGAAAAGTYWVRTIPSSGDETVSYITRVVLPQANADVPIPLTVDPPTHAIPAQGLARITPQLPSNACNVKYNWYHSALGANERIAASDADNDPSRLDIINLQYDATFWLEATWDERDGGGNCPNTASGQVRGSSAPVDITVLCEPAATIGVMTQPFDTHLAKHEMIALSAWGLGKQLHYTWYTIQPDGTRQFSATGPGQYKFFLADTTMQADAMDACGNTATAELKFYVCKPTIKTEPLDVVRNSTQTRQMSVVAEPAQANQTLSYQWYRSSATEPWTAVSGATTNSIDVSGSVTASYYCRISATCSDGVEAAVTTRFAKVEVCAKPVIGWTSYDQNVRRDQLQTLHVEATGKNLTYQWYRGASGVTTDPIAGATGDSYALYVQDTTTFWVRVFSQGECSTDSAAFTLTVSSAPEVSAITATPATVFSGGTTTLSVTATPTSSAPLSYVWFKVAEIGYVQVCGYEPTCVTEALAAPVTYMVRVTSGTMLYTESAQFTVGVCTFPQTIPAAPDVEITAGAMQLLTLPIDPATGNSITWYRGATGDTSNPIAPAGPSHQAGVNPTVTTQYWARVERDGCVSNSGTTTVRVCVPRIVTQPAAGSIVAGASHTMTFESAGTDAAQTFQWYRGNPGNVADPVAGATSATLTISPNTTTTYWCRATSNCGRTADSHATVVNVCTPPVISGVSNASIAPGQSANVNVQATGSSLSYQWYRGASGNTASPIAGATQLTLTQSPANTTQYWCRVTSSGSCWSDSPTATIDVCTPATITTEPADKSIASGHTAALSVAATGASGYQWYLGDGSAIAGATASTYTTPALTADATYFVRVLNGVCWTQSRTVTVTACNLSASISGAQIGRGQSATLTAGVAGARGQELYYTWYIGASGNTTTVWTAGAGMSSIMVSPNSTTSYWVRVNDGTCTTDSNAAIVEVCRPAITTHPAPMSINSGASTTLTVAADISPVTVQWYTGAKGNTSSPVSGATGTSVTVSPSATTSYWARVTGSCGSIDSNAAQVCVRPVITGTQGASIAPGSATTINVTATGASLTYQWYVGATGVTTSPIAGWNYAHLNVNPNSTTNYWVRVTSAGSCSTDSPTITVSVCSNPTITTQPASATMYPGYTTATLSVTASPATAYQWYRGASGDMSAPVSGATSSTFNPGALTADTTYWVRVSNGLCATNSAAATVMACRLSSTVNNAQTAVSQSTTLTVGVSNARSQSLYYTWFIGSSGNTSQVLTAGPTLSSVTVSPSTTTNYWVQVDDGTCLSYSNTATVNVCIPRVSTQPVGGTIAAGQSRTLTAASDLPGATFQWYIGTTGSGTPIAGATGASYVASPASTTNYWVLITGSCGVQVGSNTATVTVCAPPTANANPSLYSIVAGQSANIGVHASGSSLTYQWYTGASGVMTSPISGATAASLVVSPANTTQYWCRVTSSGVCTTNSGTITVDVCSSPNITAQPAASTTLGYAGNTTLSIAATSPSGGALTYQWYRGSSGDWSNPIAGATGASFNTGALYGDAQYWVTVTRGACVVGSATAYVTVCAMGVGVPDVSVAANQTATLTASLSGARTGEPYYAWYMGATGNTSTLVAAGTNRSSIQVARPSTTQYWVRVTDGGCTTDSNTANYNVCIPTITSQPANVTINTGASTTLTVGTTGAGLSYQWYQGPVNTYSAPVGTNSPSLTVAPSSTTQYWVRVLGCGGTAASSTTVTVTVCQAPWVSEPIADPPVNPGALTGVRVNTSGTGPLSYQWYRGQSGNTQNPVGTNSASYTFNIYQSEYYWVRVTSPCGSVNSPAKMVSVNPTITQQPESVMVSSGSRATFTVAADGTYLSYQWFTGMGTPISGATSATYTTPPLTYEQTFFVYVYSGNGMRQSVYVTASMCEGPATSFTAQYGGGNCYTLYVQPWTYGAFELAYDWYEGQPGDTSKPLGRGNYYRTFCTSARTTYWVRVWTPDMTCYSDTGGITLN